MTPEERATYLANDLAGQLTAALGPAKSSPDVATDELTQGSPEWLAARCGMITASRFADVLTQPRAKRDKESGALSRVATTYMLELAAETITGAPKETPVTFAMKHGNEHEPVARYIYSEIFANEVEIVGFLSHPTEDMVGGSPDGLIGDRGGLEIKCPYNTAIHLGYLLDGHAQHEAQIQGNMWITGREWWDFVTYDPRVNPLVPLGIKITRVYRDEEYIVHLQAAVRNFRERLLETIETLRTLTENES